MAGSLGSFCVPRPGALTQGALGDQCFHSSYEGTGDQRKGPGRRQGRQGSPCPSTGKDAPKGIPTGNGALHPQDQSVLWFH